MQPEKLLLEVNGIIGTILNYTNNAYITGHTKSLKKYVNQDNYTT